MQYKVASPQEYFEALENDWRKDKLIEIQKLIKKNAPNLIEGIRYNMLSYEHDNTVIFNLNAQQAYVSLYVGNIKKVNNAEELLKEFDFGKGCIRIKKSNNVVESKLEEFIKQTINLWAKGGNTDC